jgi:hypothetical protein
MHILNVPLKIFLAEKISAAIREEIAFNCDRFVVDFHVYNEIIAWKKLATIYALQFVYLVGFVTFFDMLLQIILGFKVKTALVAIFALKHFALMFLSHVAAQVHAIGTLPVGAINAQELPPVHFLVVLFFQFHVLKANFTLMAHKSFDF